MVLTYQAERMPEQIRLKVRLIEICTTDLENVRADIWTNSDNPLQVGGVDPKQLAVYEEFARNVPGFLPSNDLSQPTGFLAQPMKVSREALMTASLVLKS